MAPDLRRGLMAETIGTSFSSFWAPGSLPAARTSGESEPDFAINSAVTFSPAVTTKRGGLGDFTRPRRPQGSRCDIAGAPK
jgi:hypothetical protein